MEAKSTTSRPFRRRTMKKWLLEEGITASFIWQRVKGGWSLQYLKVTDTWRSCDTNPPPCGEIEKMQHAKYTELNQKELFLQLL